MCGLGQISESSLSGSLQIEKDKSPFLEMLHLVVVAPRRHFAREISNQRPSNPISPLPEPRNQADTSRWCKPRDEEQARCYFRENQAPSRRLLRVSSQGSGYGTKGWCQTFGEKTSTSQRRAAPRGVERIFQRQAAPAHNVWLSLFMVLSVCRLRLWSGPPVHGQRRRM
jgi:hypothetical protein